MSHPPIQFQSIDIAASPFFPPPFTHEITIQVAQWTHTSRLELPQLRLMIHPTRTPHNYILAAEITIKGHERSYAEPFDTNLSTFTGCIATLARAFGPYAPVACKHLLQGVSNAMIYFARQLGYVTLDIEEGVVTATTKRDQ